MYGDKYIARNAGEAAGKVMMMRGSNNFPAVHSGSGYGRAMQSIHN